MNDIVLVFCISAGAAIAGFSQGNEPQGVTAACCATEAPTELMDRIEAMRLSAMETTWREEYVP